MDFIQNSTAEILDELARFVEGNINFRAPLRELWDSKPVIADLKVDSLATGRAGHAASHDKPRNSLLGCLTAMQAEYAKGNAVGRTKRHLDASQGVSVPN